MAALSSNGPLTRETKKRRSSHSVLRAAARSHATEDATEVATEESSLLKMLVDAIEDGTEDAAQIRLKMPIRLLFSRRALQLLADRQLQVVKPWQSFCGRRG